jgi:hypothetical protein
VSSARSRATLPTDHRALRDDRLCVALGYARHGWVQLALISASSGESVTIQCSDVCPPFNDLLAWLHRLLDASGPATLTIDEERGFTSLRAQDAGPGGDVLELSVVSHALPDTAAEPSATPLLRCRVSRLALVAEFAQRLDRWLAEDYDPAEFGGESLNPGDPMPGGDLRRLDLAALFARLPAVCATPFATP